MHGLLLAVVYGHTVWHRLTTFPQTFDLPVSDKKVDPKISVDEVASSGRLSTASNRRDDVGGASDSEDEYVYDIYYRDVNADHAKESQQRAIGSL